MTIKELDDKLNSPGFQDPENGDLFYNFFIYQYPAEKEYDIRNQIQEFKANLIRPINYVDVLTLNLFDEFCQFLDKKKFLKHPSMLKYQLEKEQANPSKAQNTQDTLTRNFCINEFLTILTSRMTIDAHTSLFMVLAACTHISVSMSCLPFMRITTTPANTKSLSSILDTANRIPSVCSGHYQTIILTVPLS